jgi:hypothetical protein
VPTARNRRNPADGWCQACWDGDGTCPSCQRFGAYALWAIENTWRDIVDVARRRRLPLARVEFLVAQARDRRERREYDTRPLLADAQWFIAYALAHDPELTRAEIAHRMKPDMHPADFDRTFGYARTGGCPRRCVSVLMGTRLMLALGRDPYELDGC